MTSTNINNNKNNDKGLILTMNVLLDVTKISSVLLSSINITNNFATQYLTFNGIPSGDFVIDSIMIMNNMNNGIGGFDKNILIEGNNFINSVVNNSYFTNNYNGTILLSSSLNGTLDIIYCFFMNNNEFFTLIDINGVSTLNINKISVINNTAINGILFFGMNNGDVILENLIFTYNNINNSLIDGIILIQFYYFVDVNVINCDIGKNDGNYLFLLNVTGNIEYNECNIYENDIDKI